MYRTSVITSMLSQITVLVQNGEKVLLLMQMWRKRAYQITKLISFVKQEEEKRGGEKEGRLWDGESKKEGVWAN